MGDRLAYKRKGVRILFIQKRIWEEKKNCSSRSHKEHNGTEALSMQDTTLRIWSSPIKKKRQPAWPAQSDGEEPRSREKKTAAVGPTKHIMEQRPCRCKLEDWAKLVVQNLVAWCDGSFQIEWRTPKKWVYRHPGGHLVQWKPRRGWQ